jgi:POTRA domain, ShlB-type/Omp85 superfamily domain
MPSTAFVSGAGLSPPPLAGSSPPPPPRGLAPPIPTTRRRRPASLALPPPLLRVPLPLLVRDFKLIAARRLPLRVVRAAVAPLLGTRATRGRILRVLATVDEWYNEQGYVASRIAVAAFPSRGNGNVLVLAAVEAVLLSVRLEAVDKDEVVDTGVRVRTREGTVARALGIEIGSVFRWHPRAFQRLWALGVFEYVRAELEVLGPMQVGVLVSVRERRSGRIEPGLGMNSDGKSYGDLSLEEGNLFGRAQKLRIEWQRRIGMRRSAGGIEFEDPRVGARLPVAFRGRVYRDVNADRALPGGPAGEQLRAANDRDREGLMGDVGWSPGRYPRLALSTGPVVERVRPLPGDVGARADTQAMWVSSANLDLTEVGAAMPRRGRRIFVEYGLGTPIQVISRPERRRGRPEVFHRVTARAAQYVPLGAAGSLAVGGTVSLATENLPYHEQKSLGGPGTVRGFHYGELGRSPAYAIGRVELRVPLVTPVPNEEEEESSEGKEAALPGPEQDGTPAGKPRAPFKARRNENRERGIVVTKDGIQAPDGEKAVASGSFGWPKLPSIVGVLFADTASTEVFTGQSAGVSHGIGLRIGGLIAVDLARTNLRGREPRLHFGMIDRNL